ncbi:hypothetical protein CRENBAI_003509, partial [Crenichthys baileyi]
LWEVKKEACPSEPCVTPAAHGQAITSNRLPDGNLQVQDVARAPTQTRSHQEGQPLASPHLMASGNPKPSAHLQSP